LEPPPEGGRSADRRADTELAPDANWHSSGLCLPVLPERLSIHVHIKGIDWVNSYIRCRTYGCPHSPFGILSSVVKKRWPPRRGLQLERGLGQRFRFSVSSAPTSRSNGRAGRMKNLPIRSVGVNSCGRDARHVPCGPWGAVALGVSPPPRGGGRSCPGATR
jgi:hypothetical protein